MGSSPFGTVRPNVLAGRTMSWKATVLSLRIAREFDRKQLRSGFADAPLTLARSFALELQLEAFLHL
jgi:hypothetical protein